MNSMVKPRWRWKALTLWIIIFSAITIYSLVVIGQQVQDAKVAKTALCKFYSDLQRRHTDSAKFLEEHPQGIPGIPASVIANSLANEQQTLDSLRILKNCN